MGRKRQDGPKDSEISVCEWLEQIGATEIRFVGNDVGGGPPDFVVKYAGEEIAVEVCLLHDSDGWDRTEKHAFEQELRCLIKEVSKEENAPRWHSSCEYDPREPYPPRKSCKEWKEKVRKALHQGRGWRSSAIVTGADTRPGSDIGIVASKQRGKFRGSE